MTKGSRSSKLVGMKLSDRYLIRCDGCGNVLWAQRRLERCPKCDNHAFGTFWVSHFAPRYVFGLPGKELRCTDARCKLSESLKCRCSCGGSFHGDALMMEAR